MERKKEKGKATAEEIQLPDPKDKKEKKQRSGSC